jgi:hypothetical protein
MNLCGPLKSIKHLQQEKALFIDIVSNQNPDPFSFSDFENLDYLSLEEQPSPPPLRVLIYSGQFKDSGSLTLFKDVLPTEDDEICSLLDNHFQKPMML